MKKAYVWICAGLLTGCIGSPPGSSGPDAGPDSGEVVEEDGGVSDSGEGEDMASSEMDMSGGDATILPDMARDACIPRTCDDLLECGPTDDGCGGSLDCDCMIVGGPQSFTILVGEEFPLSASVRNSGGERVDDVDLTWSSSADDTEFTVNPDGLVTGVSPSSGTIVVDAVGADSVTFDVTVEEFEFGQIAAGRDHTCALTRANGRAYCWGVGTTQAIGRPGQAFPVPQRVTARDISYSEIALGQNHTCAISEDGMEVSCWGESEFGQIAADQPSFNPVEVTLPGPPPYEHLAAGLYHTCVVADDGKPVCWGRNNHRQSDPDSAQDVVPPTALGNSVSVNLSGLAAGLAFTCATNGTTVGCWGDDANGQFGEGVGDSSPSAMYEITIDGQTGLKQFAAFDAHVCAIGNSDKVGCWGFNSEGQVHVEQAPTNADEPVLTAGGNQYQFVEVGARHSCAISNADGTSLFCWGSNELPNEDHGLIGADTANASENTLAFDDQIIDVALGWFHSCVLLSDGSIECWGHNDGGKLGNDSMTNSNEPVVVAF